jgi:hypothetical protein
MRFSVAIAVLILCASFSFAQSTSDIEKTYGKPIKVYAVGEHIWMTPDYAADGQVCRLRLYPKRIGAGADYLSQKLPFDELRDVLNSLVPADQRGSKIQPFGLTDTGRPAAWTTYGYEKVTFTFVMAFSPQKFDKASPLSTGFVFRPSGARTNQRSETLAPSNDDFRNSRSSATEIVTVKWNDRKCAAQ